MPRPSRVGMGAKVTVVDRSAEALKRLASAVRHLDLAPSSRPARRSRNWCRRADLLIGTVLVPGRRRAEARHPRHGQDDEARLGDRRRRHRPGRLRRDLARRPPIRTRPMSSTASCITASPTCRARSRAPRPSRSTTRRCRSRWRSPTRAGARRSAEDPHLRNGLNVCEGKVTCAAGRRGAWPGVHEA